MLIFFLIVWYFLVEGFGREGCCVILIDWDFGFFCFFLSSVMRNVFVGLAGCVCNLAYRHL